MYIYSKGRLERWKSLEGSSPTGGYLSNVLMVVPETTPSATVLQAW